MYKFFNPSRNKYIEISDIPVSRILVRLDQNINTVQSLCGMYGIQIYTSDLMDSNPIFENTTYFGRNLESFEECLRLASKATNSSIIAIHQSELSLSSKEREYYYSILKRNSSPLQNILAGSSGFSFCFGSNIPS